MNPTLKGLSPMFRNLVATLIPEMDPAVLMRLWGSLKSVPGGKIVFSELLKRVVPYTGTISPLVMELGPGQALVVMTDRAGIRNHLRSVHAMALANLGECASGLALLAQVPGTHQGILVDFQVEYLKKARGSLTARGSVLEFVDVITVEEQIAIAHAEIRNAQQEVVARCVSKWKVSARGFKKKGGKI